MQPTDFLNQRRDILASIRDKILVVHRCAQKIDVFASRHNEAAAACLLSALDI